MDPDDMHRVLQHKCLSGWELFQREMERHGAAPRSATSRGVQIALQIIAENDDCYKGAIEGLLKALEEERNELNREKNKYRCLIGDIPDRLSELKDEEAELDEREEELARREAELVKREEVQQDIENKITHNYETKGMRDRMRAAAFFKQEANPQNVYQQTAYINGLAAILAGQKDTDEEEKP